MTIDYIYCSFVDRHGQVIPEERKSYNYREEQWYNNDTPLTNQSIISWLNKAIENNHTSVYHGRFSIWTGN